MNLCLKRGGREKTISASTSIASLRGNVPLQAFAFKMTTTDTVYCNRFGGASWWGCVVGLCGGVVCWGSVVGLCSEVV